MQEQFRGSYQHAKSHTQKLDINTIMKGAYEHVKTRRGPFMGAFAWTLLLLFAAVLFVGVLIQVLSIEINERVEEILGIAIQTLILAPCVAGLYLVSLKTTLTIKPTREDFFLYFQNPWRIIGTAIVIALFTQVGLVFGTAIGLIWMAITQILFTLAIPMAALYQAKPFAAVIGSMQLAWQNIGAFFIFHLVLFAFYMLIGIGVVILITFAQAGSAGMVAAILGGLALAYVLFTRVIPLYFFTIAEMYRILFGISPSQDANSVDGNNPVVNVDQDDSAESSKDEGTPRDADTDTNKPDDFRA